MYNTLLVMRQMEDAHELLTQQERIHGAVIRQNNRLMREGQVVRDRGIAKNSIGVNHSHFDRYGWGNETVYGSEGLIFNQYLDAIELTFNDTQIYRSNDTCQ